MYSHTVLRSIMHERRHSYDHLKVTILKKNQSLRLVEFKMTHHHGHGRFAALPSVCGDILFLFYKDCTAIFFSSAQSPFFERHVYLFKYLNSTKLQKKKGWHFAGFVQICEMSFTVQ